MPGNGAHFPSARRPDPPSEPTDSRTARDEVFRTALEAVSDGVWEWWLDNDDVYFSRNYYELLGFKDHEFSPCVGAWVDRIHPDDLPIMISLVNEYQAGLRLEHSVEFRMRHRDGEWRWFLSRGKLLEGRRLLGTHVDVTHRRNAEMQLRASHAYLESAISQRTEELERLNEGLKLEIANRRRIELQLRRLATALEQSPVSVIMTDSEGRIEYVNRQFEELTGYTFDEVYGLRPSVLKSGMQPAEFYRRMWESLVAGEVWRGEFHNRRKDGSLFWEFAVIAPLRDADGNVTGYVSLKEDITALKEARARNTALREELAAHERLAVIGQTVATVVHSMKNLMTVIQGGMHLLNIAERELDLTTLANSRALLESGVWRLNACLGEMLEYSKTRASRFERVDVKEAVGRIVEMLSTFAQIKHVAIMLEELPGPLVAWLDRGLLENCILNLASNAFDAMPLGGTLRVSCLRVAREDLPHRKPDLDFTAKAEPDGDWLVIEMEDSGGGIESQDIPHLFDPFFSTKGSRGTGLGLVTVSRFVAELHGAILIESTHDHGTRFTLRFPPAVFSAPEKA